MICWAGVQVRKLLRQCLGLNDKLSKCIGPNDIQPVRKSDGWWLRTISAQSVFQIWNFSTTNKKKGKLEFWWLRTLSVQSVFQVWNFTTTNKKKGKLEFWWLRTLFAQFLSKWTILANWRIFLFFLCQIIQFLSLWGIFGIFCKMRNSNQFVA